MTQNKENTILKIEGLGKQFAQKTIFSQMDIEMEHGEIIAILGPSGCGKSTLLRMISGLETVEEGSISIIDKDENEIVRGIDNVIDAQLVGLIFQKPVLFPHLNVSGNIMLGIKNPPAKKLQVQVAERYLKDVGLSGFSDNSIETLSGGESQRVCLIRALISEPKILLLDEPFSALDVKARRKIATETKQLLKQKGISAIHVTHDPEEAELISDRVINWQEITE
ncbi:MAG: ABC transporter ATP-binding protein [Euryarchaeota archaeon]|jgi:ABC-type Fe3+/spermidine/putrescine transport system ATPase subunit|nr:ABC transporter ATP-binding protein [Euryarchaeota archaeon]